ANWLMKAHPHVSPTDGHILSDEEEFLKLGVSATEEEDTWDQKRKLLEKKLAVVLYVLLTLGIVALLFMNIGRDVLPKVNSGQFQVRLRAPDGTRLERTEEETISALHILEDLVGKENISVTSAFVGQHPGQFSTSPIYLFMSGPQEAVLQVALKETYKEKLDALK